MSINMSCINHRHKLTQDQELLEHFEQFTNMLQPLRKRLNIEVNRALDETINSVHLHGTEGLRVHFPRLFKAISRCDLPAAPREKLDLITKLLS